MLSSSSLLKTDISVVPIKRLVTVPAVIAPETLRAVRPMSISGSMEMSKPTSATGRSSADNTISAEKVAPPPTLATPNELIEMMAMSVIMKPMSNGLIPTVGATITASIAG